MLPIPFLTVPIRLIAEFRNLPNSNAKSRKNTVKKNQIPGCKNSAGSTGKLVNDAIEMIEGFRNYNRGGR
jgi:hypothetical protein